MAEQKNLPALPNAFWQRFWKKDEMASRYQNWEVVMGSLIPHCSLDPSHVVQLAGARLTRIG